MGIDEDFGKEKLKDESAENSEFNPDEEIQKYEREKKELVQESKDKTIFNEEISYPDKRFLLENVPVDSNFMKSYDNYLDDLADHYARELPEDIVTFSIVIEKYQNELNSQKTALHEEYSMEVNLTLFPLEINDIQKLTTLINRKKR